ECNSGVLAVGQFCLFSINYQAQSVGNHIVNYLFNYSSNTSSLSGQTSLIVTAQTPEASLDIALSNTNVTFGSVNVSQGTAIRVTVSNIGGIEFHGSNVSASSNSSDFQVIKSNCASLLEPGKNQVCELSISFNPQSSGLKSGI